MTKEIMKNGSTILLRLTLIGMGLVASAVGMGLTMGVNNNWAEEFPSVTYASYPIMIGLLITIVAFWGGLYHAFKLLDLIDSNKSFTKHSVRTLQRIKYCALVIAGVFTLGLPAVFHVAQKEDAPGLVLIVGTLFIGAPTVVAVFASVCQRLFQNAIDIKSENDLTV